MSDSTRHKHIALIALFFVVLLLTCTSNRKDNKASSPIIESSHTIQAEISSGYDPFNWNYTFSVLNSKYVIASGDGKGMRIDSYGTERAFTLPLEEFQFIENLMFYSYREDIILVYGVGDGESGGGVVVRLDKDTLQIKWQLLMPCFNLSVGTIEKNNLYQAGIGFVSNIDLDNGRYVWKHQGLYERSTGSFNSFMPPLVESEEILFKSIHHKTKKLRTIKANKLSGNLVID